MKAALFTGAKVIALTSAFPLVGVATCGDDVLRLQWPETAMAIGLLFAVVMNAQLLLPNPYMPEPVRMAHLLETASSNFILGVPIGWLLTNRHAFTEVALARRAS